ncbi:MAG TPA: hypothetical protein HPP81_02115 [Deltaproteobacteria bacterium]|nr:hypothetical protein [Deltaproteobacteria bacterium]
MVSAFKTHSGFEYPFCPVSFGSFFITADFMNKMFPNVMHGPIKNDVDRHADNLSHYTGKAADIDPDDQSVAGASGFHRQGIVRSRGRKAFALFSYFLSLTIYKEMKNGKYKFS